MAGWVNKRRCCIQGNGRTPCAPTPTLARPNRPRQPRHMRHPPYANTGPSPTGPGNPGICGIHPTPTLARRQPAPATPAYAASTLRQHWPVANRPRQPRHMRHPPYANTGPSPTGPGNPGICGIHPTPTLARRQPAPATLAYAAYAPTPIPACPNRPRQPGRGRHMPHTNTGMAGNVGAPGVRPSAIWGETQLQPPIIACRHAGDGPAGGRLRLAGGKWGWFAA